MDETTKVIIATLSGFIIAFFAEPVKNYFQDRAKLRNLRIALYKEVFYNYTVLSESRMKIIEDEAEVAIGDYLSQRVLRTECYKHALENEISLFYQLDEAHMIHILEGRLLGQIMNLYGDMNNLLGEEVSRADINPAFAMLSRSFQNSFAILVYVGTLQAKVLKKIISKDEYLKLVEKGKNTPLPSES
jgi:hypothetical protein